MLPDTACTSWRRQIWQHESCSCDWQGLTVPAARPVHLRRHELPPVTAGFVEPGAGLQGMYGLRSKLFVYLILVTGPCA